MANDQVLRTGVLFKKGSGQGPFGRRNWKPRYFVLTPSKLSYYTYEDGDLKGEINLEQCNENSIEVMPADAMKTGSSASTIWRIAINSNDRRLLVAAGTEMEMNDWVEQFRVAFSINSGQPLPPQRGSFNSHVAPVSGAIATTATADYSRNSITDFQNFAPARKSVTGGYRASMGVHGGHEFRLSDEFERQKQAEAQRVAMEEERKREEEALQMHLRTQAEEKRRQKEAEEKAEQEREQQRVEQMLEEQRRLKREQHERERVEAERQLRELELQKKAQRHHQYEEVQVTRSRPSSRSPSSSPARSPTGPSSSSSSLVTDAKREAIARQQIEHNKRREQAIKEAHEQKRREFLEQKKAQEDAIRARQNKSPAASPVARPAPPPPQKAEQRSPPRSPPQPPPQPPKAMSSYEF